MTNDTKHPKAPPTTAPDFEAPGPVENMLRADARRAKLAKMLLERQLDRLQRNPPPVRVELPRFHFLTPYLFGVFSGMLLAIVLQALGLWNLLGI